MPQLPDGSGGYCFLGVHIGGLFEPGNRQLKHVGILTFRQKIHERAGALRR
jgi:hypothetical protein